MDTIDTIDTIRVSSEWQRIAEKIRDNPGIKTVFLVGGCDTGKSTFAHYLVRTLSASCVTGYLDCDPGQSVLSTPATLCLGLYDRAGSTPFNITAPAAKYLKFVGSNTPVGHLLENVCSMKKLLEKAYSSGAAKVIIDSCGYVQDAVARSFQFFSIDMAFPDFIIELAGEHSLRYLLLNFSAACEIAVVAASPAVNRKQPEVRKANREAKIRQYFAHAQPADLDFSTLGLHGRIPDFRSKETYADLLVSLCNKNHFVVVLGIVTDIDPAVRKLSIMAPPFPKERVTGIHFGSLYCALTGEHRYRFSQDSVRSSEL